MNCPICQEECRNENDLIGHLLLVHGLPAKIALQMAKEEVDNA